MVVLLKGANTAVTGSALRARLTWQVVAGTPDIDLSALLLGADGKVRTDDDFVFFNQPRHTSGAVVLEGGQSAGTAQLEVELDAVEAVVERILITASADGATFGAVHGLVLALVDLASGAEVARFEQMGVATETALVAGELYRRAGAWKFRAVGQGWASGLAGLATEYGISVSGEEPLAPNEHAPAAVLDVPAPPMPAGGDRAARWTVPWRTRSDDTVGGPDAVAAVGARPGRAAAAAPRQPVAYRLPGSLWPSTDVVGESHYTPALQHVLGRLRRGEDRELEVDATLVPEPKNRHDRNAVAVQIDGAIVGYMAREEAVRWQPVVTRLQTAGAQLVVRARVWGVNRPAAEGGFFSSVRLALPDPELALPLNAPPAGPYSIVPWGARLKISGEPEQLNPLSRHLGSQQEGLLLVALRTRGEKLQRGAGRVVVDALVEGTAVGSLTPASSKNISPLVDHLERRGVIATSWATVRGSSLAIELGLQAARASEVPEQWMHADPMTVPAELHRIR